MGDPRKTRSKYQGPRHPWNKERIEREKKLLQDYGLTNKKELWKAESALTNYKDNLKRLIATTGKQAERELQQLFTKLQKYGLAGNDATADDILGLTTEQLLDRRLQTLLVKKELAKNPKQARQFITHGHITVNDKKMTTPSYLVPTSEEDTIAFITSSNLTSEDHPERAAQQASKEPPKTNKEKAEEPAPTTKTEKTKEADKPIEQKIEEQDGTKKKVAEAIETTEADTVAADHEQAVKEAAKKEEGK
ncbi:30S ribosomal protein S4 [Candidatus Woesearchaeota archaeon]|nr:30S ribosomal protein S4 [Candidatus Woesearchaeota archaeon]